MHLEKCLLFTAFLIEFINMDVHAFGIILPTLMIKVVNYVWWWLKAAITVCNDLTLCTENICRGSEIGMQYNSCNNKYFEKVFYTL